MATISAAAVVVAPFLESPLVRAAIAASYVWTFLWWDAGAGSLWVSLLVVGIGILRKLSGGGGDGRGNCRGGSWRYVEALP